MTAIAFDPLEYTHALEEAGFTRDQAELVAKVGSAMFIQNFDALVTRDNLDMRLSEMETRILSTMELRFSEADTRTVLRFKDIDAKFGRLYLMGSIIMAATVIPVLQRFFAWMA